MPKKKNWFEIINLLGSCLYLLLALNANIKQPSASINPVTNQGSIPDL